MSARVELFFRDDPDQRVFRGEIVREGTGDTATEFLLDDGRTVTSFEVFYRPIGIHASRTPRVLTPTTDLTLERVDALPQVRKGFQERGALLQLGPRRRLHRAHTLRDNSGRYRGVLVSVGYTGCEHARYLKAFHEWEGFERFFNCVVAPGDAP